MKFNNNKKAALNLSINAIVVLIIAIVFLGLALTFTRNILTSSGEKLLSGIDSVDISNPADANHPITYDGQFEVKRGSKKTMKISFYNTDSSLVTATPDFGACVGDGTGTPEIQALSTDVQGNSESRFQAIIRAGELDPGDYVCQLVIKNSANATLETLQVPFKVSS